MIQWFDLDPNNEDAIFMASTEVIKQLQQIRPSDMGKAVPYANIVDDKNNSLTIQLTKPPQFGESRMFDERPYYSLGEIKVNNVNPGGWILYRTIDFSITVHNPTILNDEDIIINKLLTPGNKFTITYGWSGGSNSVIGGKRVRTEDQKEAEATHSEEIKQYQETYKDEIAAGKMPEKPDFYTAVIRSKTSMKFVIINFDFALTEAGEITFNFSGIEDAEYGMRKATIIEYNTTAFQLPTANTTEADKKKREEALAKYIKKLNKDALKKLSDNINGKTIKSLRTFTSKKKKDPNKDPEDTGVPEEFIEFKDALDAILTDSLSNALIAEGYKNPHLYLGLFNKFCPKTIDEYGAQECENRSIAKFLLKKKDVLKVISNMTNAGAEMTVQNAISALLGLMSTSVFSSQQVAEKDANGNLIAKKMMAPDIFLYTDFDAANDICQIAILDRKRYITRLYSSKPDTEYADKSASDKNKEALFNAIKSNVPIIKLYHRASYIKSLTAEVQNDDQMKSIFLRREVDRQGTRSNIDKSVPPRPALADLFAYYRSSIDLRMTVIGNFGMKMLNLVWVDFGIDRMNGAFWILEKSDTISTEGFYSELRFVAEGSNPLGTPDNMAAGKSLEAMSQYKAAQATAP